MGERGFMAAVIAVRETFQTLAIVRMSPLVIGRVPLWVALDLSQSGGWE